MQGAYAIALNTQLCLGKHLSLTGDHYSSRPMVDAGRMPKFRSLVGRDGPYKLSLSPETSRVTERMCDEIHHVIHANPALYLNRFMGVKPNVRRHNDMIHSR